MQISDELRRLAKAYADGLVEEREYEIQRKLLQENIETLIIPEIAAVLYAGELLESLELVEAGEG